ncbi:ABC transporter permease/M1 family aminopeptidase [Reichenbachiella sp.]|uniref:ABC transporter permease/M1 family aminopeptidase n=1 Tax=Reichenbachiella sp. TaxID=2184521 RepID=UPI003B59DB7A
MFFEIFKFELKYRSKRPATYIYFGILFLMAFLAMTTDIVRAGGANAMVKENAPAVLAAMTMNMFLIIMFMASAVMGVAVLRDFEHKTESLMFSNPIKKRDYLFGRFAGSFVVMVFIASGLSLGFMLGEFWPGIGSWWPGREADKLLPFNAWYYWQPFFVVIIPNLFFTGVLFFASGSLSRNMLAVYTQGIGFFVLYRIARNFTGDLDNKLTAAIVDPMASSTIQYMTQYWTVAEQNTLLLPLEGAFLWNRVLWISLGIIGLVVTYYSFSFDVVRTPWFGRKKKATEQTKLEPIEVEIPKISRSFGKGSIFKQLVKQSIFYFKVVTKEVTFLGIVLSGLALIFISSTNMNRMYGANTYASTYAVLELISGSFSIFFVIIVVFFSGELIWKERAVKMDLIYDSMPVTDAINLLSKFFGMLLVYVVLILSLIVSGIIVQTAKGYYDYEIGLYFTDLFSSTFTFLALFTMLSFFIHVMVNNKFLGHAVIILFFITTGILSSLGLEHSLFQFGSANLGTYSDMNGYGHYVTSFSWMDLYWFGFSCFLMAMAIFFAVRGSESILKTRFKIGKLRLTKPVVTFILSSLMIFGLSGCYIYYNTNILNEYQNSDEQDELQADYEKQLKKYVTLAQPKIVDINLSVDIYPETRDFTAQGYYIISNKSNEVISDVHIQAGSDQSLKISNLEFEGGAEIKEEFNKFKYTIYSLNKPMNPGDSIKMDWTVEFKTVGFVESGSNTSVVYNGTFFNNFMFPSFGYNENFELTAIDKRKEQDLPEKEKMLKRDDPRGLSMSLLTDDADRVNFEIVMSTSPDQVAIAPGYLQKQWEKDGRSYYHYKMDKPILPFFSMISARYEIMRDVWVSAAGDSVDLEIYYHKGHEYNLDRMMKSMKKSFDYFTTHYSPYQYDQMRIMEFPRYSSFAQSFANTVPFSEGIGFNLKIEEDDVDMAYYVTAHELAHQWWAHQVTEANVQGNAMLSETMSQYSALMVMKQEYPPEMMQKFLKHELDRYLRGRKSETLQERPLELVEGQGYIHYRKGSVIMYAFQDYISEDSVNVALQRFIADYAYQEDPYVTSDMLVDYFREVTPDSLQYIIDDMFENITLFENKAKTVSYKKMGKKQYELELIFESKKLRADSLGNTSEIAMEDWVDIGVYGKPTDGEKDRLIYLKKHKVTAGEASLKIMLDEEPVKAGIDPINKLIDRNPDDNVKSAVEALGS